MFKRIATVLLTAMLSFGSAPFTAIAFAQQIPTFGNPSALSRPGGTFYAAAFNTYAGRILSGNSSTGSGTSITVAVPNALADGTVIAVQNLWSNGPLTPILVNDNNVETVTPTSTSFATCPAGNLGVGGSPLCATITGTFNNTHGQGAVVQSGTFGLQEAVNQAFLAGGGTVVVDAAWTQLGGTNAMLAAVVPFQSVTIADYRAGEVQFWRPVPNNVTTLATPTALTVQAACDATHTTCSDATAVGTWTAAAYYFCIAYVDVMGNEGTCSTTANFTAVVNKAVDVAVPAASAGAVGYKIYGGVSYAAATEVPLTSSNCILTKVEMVTAACAVPNTVYNQVNPVANTVYGSTSYSASVPTLTVTTSKLALNATTTSSTTDYVGNPGSVTVYKYAPASRTGISGIQASYTFFPVGAAAATTVPNVIGTVAIPAGYMNYVGRSIEVCGYATEASAGSTATIQNMQLWWDANGSDTATGVPILVGTNPSTNTLVTAKTDQFRFCYELRTTVAGASATAGSIIQDNALFINQYTSSGVATVPVVALGQGPAAVGSLNLAGEARIHIVWLHTTGTDGAGVQLQRVTIRDIS